MSNALYLANGDNASLYTWNIAGIIAHDTTQFTCSRQQ